MRIRRNLSEETKRKIAEALKNKPKSEKHKKALSIALRNYWKTIPYKEDGAELLTTPLLYFSKVTKLAKMQDDNKEITPMKNDKT